MKKKAEWKPRNFIAKAMQFVVKNQTHRDRTKFHRATKHKKHLDD